MPYPALVSFLKNICLDNPFLEVASDESLCGDPLSVWEWEVERPHGSEQDPTPLFQVADPMHTLQEHLRLQMLSAAQDEQLRRAGFVIIGCIDSRGYLRESLEDLARGTGLPRPLLEQALTLIHRFSPAGVGARDLRECLLLQADPRRRDRPVIEALLALPVEQLAQRDARNLARSCGASVSEVNGALRYLSTLSPDPGSQFPSIEPVCYLCPEIVITTQGNEIHCTIQSGCELVSVSDDLYHALTSDPALDKDTSDYIREKYQEANALIQQLNLRRRTLESLMLLLIQVQRDYFLYPKGPLKPLTMRQAAAILGVHPSTISRCVTGRYIQTKHGIVPLRQLFTQSIPSTTAGVHSAGEAKCAIRALIQQESPNLPLSDQELARQLENRGILLSRRTVAKYREQLGIAGSRARHRKG
jgi:RNA polymerase sigma-54 factor